VPLKPKQPCKHPRCPALVPVGVRYCARHSEIDPPAPCREPGCPELVKPPDRYCAAHQAEKAEAYDRARGTTAERGYGAAWQRVRRWYLAEYPLCEVCEAAGRVKAAEQVHHISHDTRNNSPDNLQAVCVPCHRQLERDYQKGRQHGR